MSFWCTPEHQKVEVDVRAVEEQHKLAIRKRLPAFQVQ